MDAEAAGIQIRAWEAVGAMSPSSIFARLDQHTIDSFDDGEITALSRIFKQVCEDKERMTKSAFTSFALSKVGLSSTLTDALHVLFDSLCYLSQVPLQTIRRPPTELTLEDLWRGLMWLLPSRVGSVIQTVVGYRIRSSTDHKRLVFQSLSSPETGLSVAQIESSLTSDEDEDDDEMLQDVLDVLVSTQPYIPVGFAEPTRDAYFELAKQLHKGSPSINKLVAPKHRLESILALVLATNFRDGVLVVDQDLKSVARSMAASFCPEAESGPDAKGRPKPMSASAEGCTWPMFRYATEELLPRLFDPLSNLLGTIFFDRACSFDAHIGYFPTSVPGKVLTWPRMAQLETFLFNSICVADTRRFHSYSKSALPTSSELLRDFKGLPESAVLVVSGRSASGHECVFGAFVARPLIDGPCIQDGASSFEDTAVIFSLSPIHDVYKGQVGKSAWTLHEDQITFGIEGHGAALVLDMASATVRFVHAPSKDLKETIYRPNEHKDKYEVRFSIEEIELWAEESS